MRARLASPALHFVAIGGMLFAAHSWRASLAAPADVRVGEAKTIVVGAAEVGRRRVEFAARTGRLPEADEERALLEDAVDEEILHREAVAHGLDRSDEVVRRRLAEIADAVSDDPRADESTLVDEARTLGLDRSDLYVRRRLVELMRSALRATEAPDPITDADLREALERDPDRYRLPARVTLSHVYLSRGRRGADVESEARALVAKLRSTKAAPELASALGDPFPMSARLADVSDRDLERTFGAAFAAAVATAKTGEWSGPFASSSGQHAVWVHERSPARIPSLDAVRAQLLRRLRDRRADERYRRALERLRAEYTIRIDDAGDVGLALARPAYPPAD